MKLSDLAAVLESGTRVLGDLHREITGLTDHSGSVRPGSLFVAVPGNARDGHEFLPEALARGAVAVVAERTLPALPGVTRIQVACSRRALSALADRFHGSPCARIRHLAGVTGTNGKTTVTYLLKQIAAHHGLNPGVIGTTGVLVGDRYLRQGNLTTPGAVELHALLAEMAGAGVNLAGLEVSSHALDQHRTDHVRFDAAAFTNLTHEHLDYHGDMAQYYAAKARLFRQLRPGAVAVSNLDDEYGGRMLREVPPGVEALGYSLHRPADLWAESLQFDASGAARYRLHTPAGSARLHTPGLFGEYNVSNALAAAGLALGLGIPFETVVAALERARGAPGRFERVEAGQDFQVIVDYAHTPDAFSRLLASVRRIQGAGRIILVFGANGGGRDRSKRPVMGRIAAEYADRIILTEDDSSWEKTSDIMQMIEAGTRGQDCPVEQIEDRLAAIGRATGEARPGDLVLILGMGHQTTIAVSHPTTWAGDVSAARQSLQRRLGGAPGPGGNLYLTARDRHSPGA